MNEQAAYEVAKKMFGDDLARIIAFIEGWRFAMQEMHRSGRLK